MNLQGEEHKHCGLLCHHIVYSCRQIIAFRRNCRSHPASRSGFFDVFSSKYKINRLTPNDPYSGRTAPLTSKRCILYIYSTNIGTEYFKHGIYSPFFPLQNAVCFIILIYLVPVLFTIYIYRVC